MSKQEISYKRLADKQEVISYLQALAQSFEDGRIVVAHGEKAVDLAPPSVVTLEIEAKQKKDKTKFGFEIIWKHTSDSNEWEPLKITSGADESETPTVD
jgi:amphi-Trp domain-containing protein